jgi:hypothetical protein
MISQSQIDQQRRALRATFPLIGPWRRRSTAEWIYQHRNDPVVIPLLVEALSHKDPVVAAKANMAAKNLNSAPAIDVLCAAWAETRDRRLGDLIVAKKYIASQPINIRLLSAIKAGKIVQVNGADMVPILIANLTDSDQGLRKGVIKALEAINDGPALEALCDEAIRRPRGVVAKFCRAEGKSPRNHERFCLFLFVTRQLDQYFKEDFEFQNLRQEFARADATVQQHVMEVLRSGDRRWLGWFTSGKSLYDRDQHEIELALNSYETDGKWDKFFSACLELPLKITWTRFPKLKTAGWSPDDAALRSVLEEIIRETDGTEAPATRMPPAISSLFELWLARGHSAEFNLLSSSQILKRLVAATPPDGVALVAALASKEKPGAATADRIRNHTHWLVRLAGYATGLCPVLMDEKVSDSNYWIGELAMAADVLSVVPGRANLADLKRLQQLPQEAFVGRPGAARRLLRTILNYRNTIGAFGKDVTRAGIDQPASRFSR